MTEQQSTSDVLMIRPASFCSNLQTIESNHFQQPTNNSTVNHQEQAQREFNGLVAKLSDAQVRVLVFDDTPAPTTPDALFPNNWASFHADGTTVLYPMLALNRRQERRHDILLELGRKRGFGSRRTVDLTHYEQTAKFLEGTGSLVLDRVNRIAYACLSPRTHREVLEKFGRLLNYRVIAFNATDSTGAAIYHTNVLMSIGAHFATICSESIASEDRHVVFAALRSTGHNLVEISRAQMHAFAGNMLELSTTGGGKIIALSQSATDALSAAQLKHLEECSGPLVIAAIPTIEALGGGSVRCMLAEIHLPRAVTV